MLNIDRVWSRVAQRSDFQGMKASQYRLQVIVQSFTLTSAQISNQTPVNFPAGMIIVGIEASSQVEAQTGLVAQQRSLDMFRFSLDYQATNSSLIGTARAIGSAVFGQYGDSFPAKEIVIPINGSLLYTVENLTTSTLDVTFAHHGLVPSAIG
jgi:hypothetical protein